MTTDKQIDTFIDGFVKELEEENVAVFAGAGLSVAAGYVSWRELLKPIAEELGLDVDVEHDLISIAQYHLNERQNRSGLNHTLIEQFSVGHKASENHHILARLPIRTFWTTNYDSLIEDTLKSIGKIADVKYTVDQLKHTKPKRDAILYKMHGDINHPDDAVLTKDDYEKYTFTRGPFVTALSGDLVSKTFLFVGFSFTDPNLDYILSRVRLSLYGKPRQHYCVFRRCRPEDYDAKEKFDYAVLKQNLALNDLKRFGIQALLVNDYSDITVILRRIEDRFRQKTVFISGSAAEYGAWSQAEGENFIRDLSQALVASGCKIVSGFGFGVGAHVISGALHYVYSKGSTLHDQLIMRPFPQGKGSEQQKDAYRRDMVAHAGIAVFIFGNNRKSGTIGIAEGVKTEFALAKDNRLKLLPVGSTGYAAEELWKHVRDDFDTYYPNADAELKRLFQALGDPADAQTIIANVLKFIGRLKTT